MLWITILRQKIIQSPIKAGLILSLEPLCATLIAIPVLGEVLSVYKLIGIFIIIIAILLCEWQSYKDLKRKYHIQ